MVNNRGAHEQLEDSESSEDTEDVEQEQENMNYRMMKRFHGRSLCQKLEIFKRVLRQSHQSFILVKTGLKTQQGKGGQKWRRYNSNLLL